MPIAVAQSPSKLAVALPAILADRGNVSARDMRSHPIGTGPFKFVECKPNQSIKVARNLDYVQLTDHLFQGRFGAVVMDVPHLLAAARYIALNPVVAG